MSRKIARMGLLRPGRSVFGLCLILIASTALAVGVITSSISYVLTKSLVNETVSQFAASSSQGAVANLGGAVRFAKTDDVLGQLENLAESSNGYLGAAWVVNLNAERLAEIGAAQPGTNSYAEAIELAISTGERQVLGDGLIFAEPIPFGKEGATAGALITFWTTEPTLVALNSANIQNATITAAVLLILLGLSYALLLRFVGKPLDALRHSVIAVANGDYNTIVAGVGKANEIGTLAKHLDDMRGNLATAQEIADRKAEDNEADALVISHLRTSMQALSAGNLNAQISDNFPERFEQLRSDFNTTASQLKGSMEKLAYCSDRIRQEAEDISTQSGDLSRRTENQAATLEQTAAALDELTSSVKVVASDAREVESIVNIAQTEAMESSKVVEEAVAAMSEIENSSNQISTIISVIDDIAFQTNLLALNAGVEAARAGDAGRGFAVVASEVRALAQRSSQAAQEIKTLIGGSSEQVAQGVELVAKTGAALSAIADRVQETASLTTKMAKGAANQSTSLGEINIGVGQLDQATQRNAGMVEQASTASVSLREQSLTLAEIVSFFQIDAPALQTSQLSDAA